MKKFYVFLLTLTACSSGGGDGGGNGGGGQPPPPNPDPPLSVQTQQVFAGVTLSAPTALKQAPGDASRWFALEQRGVITITN